MSLTSTTSRIAAAASSSGRAHRHVAQDHDDLAFEVDPPRLVRHRHRIAGAEEAIGSALVDQRVGPERRRHFGAARLPHQFDVVHVGRAVRPLVGARKRGGAIMLVETEGRHGAVLQLLGEVLKLRRVALPVVECGLECRHDEECIGGAGQIPRDHDEPAVPALFERCKLHSHEPRFRAWIEPILRRPARGDVHHDHNEPEEKKLFEGGRPDCGRGHRCRACGRPVHARGPLAPDLQLPEIARYDLRHGADLGKVSGRGVRQQVPDPDLRGRRNRRRPAGAGRRADRRRRMRPYADLLLLREGTFARLRHRRAVRAQRPAAAFLVALRRRQGDRQRGPDASSTRSRSRAEIPAPRWAGSSARRSRRSPTSTA